MSKILVIDDEPSTRLLLQNRLKDQGHAVAVAQNGAEGVLEAKREAFDLFLVAADLSSGIGATEVCRRIKQTPQITGVPVLIVSNRAQTKEEMHQGYEAGCEAYLAKSDMPLLEDVVRAHLRVRSLHADLGRQLRALEDENRRIQETRQRSADSETARGESGEQALVARELSAAHPDGLLVVDRDGIVRFADRGARDYLGSNLEGRNLGSLAPSTGLEAFVRDAHTDVREGFRFDLQSRSNRPGRSLSATVVPLVPNPGERDPGKRVVLLLDAGRRRVAAEILALQEEGLPRQEVGVLREAARTCFRPSRVVGESAGIAHAREVVAEHGSAASAAPVMLWGEEGAGKSFLARCLHFGGGRAGPLIPVDCSALSAEHLEREIFGHAKGAFPEATSNRPGALHLARHGTVLLQFADSMPLDLQRRVLDTLRTGELRRVGSERVERSDALLVVELRDDPDVALREGRLLRELLEQVDWVRLEAPPLRTRMEDVRPLTQAFLERYSGARNQLEFSEEALLAMEHYHWPGNVRELETCVERACAIAAGTEVGLAELPQSLRDLRNELPDGQVLHPVRPKVAIRRGTHLPMNDGARDRGRVAEGPGEISELSLDAYEKQCLLDTLQRTGWDKLKAAKVLKIGKSTLYRKLKKYEIT